MRTRQLEYLVALERERHFGRAAAACHVTQPTLSAGLRALEAELGLGLVRRGPRFEGLTAEGALLLPWAQRAIASERDLAREAEALRTGEHGTLRVAAVPTALPAVARLTAAFVAGHDDVRVEVRSSTSAAALQGLEAFTCDVGVTYLDDAPDPGWRRVALYDERYVLVGPEGGPFAGRQTVRWDALGGVRMCLLTPDMRNRRLLDERFALAGAQPAVVATTDSPGVLLDHVRSGLHSVVAEAWTADPSSLPGVAVRRLTGLHVGASTVGLVVPAAGPPRPLVRAFLAFAAGAVDAPGAPA